MKVTGRFRPFVHAAFVAVGIVFCAGESVSQRPAMTYPHATQGRVNERQLSSVDTPVRAPTTQSRGTVTAEGTHPTETVELRAGRIVATLCDNSRSPQVLSGLQSLFHTTVPDFDAFDPDTPGASAGLNFEHIISGHRNRDNRFAPRHGRSDLYPREHGRSATLVRRREDCPWDVSSTLTYTVKEPHYVDFDFRCTPHSASRFGQRGYAICFFANYMNDVEDPAIHFLGVKSRQTGETWIAADAPAGHPDWNHGGTYRHRDASAVEYDDDHDFKLNSWSYDYPRYTKPFYYGRAARGMVLLIMFDRAYTAEDEIRFSLFKFKLPKRPRPAWDFQYVIHRVAEDRQYGFRGRLVWKKWISQEDCLDEYESWR